MIVVASKDGGQIVDLGVNFREFRLDMNSPPLLIADIILASKRDSGLVWPPVSF